MPRSRSPRFALTAGAIATAIIPLNTWLVFGRSSSNPFGPIFFVLCLIQFVAGVTAVISSLFFAVVDRGRARRRLGMVLFALFSAVVALGALVAVVFAGIRFGM